MAEKTIKTQETDPTPDLPDGPTQYDASLKISQLTTLQDPAASDYAVLARPNGDTFKVSLSTLRADLSAYKVKEVVKGNYIENITETSTGNGIWKINAEYQGSTSGNYVESLNNASGDLTLSSSDGSILIDNRLRDLEDNLLDPVQYGTNIDLTLNTTTSTMFRAWIEVTEANKTGGVFNFNNDKISKENSIVTINGVVLEGTQYDLTTGQVTILNLAEYPLEVGDEIGVVSYTAEVPNSTFGNPTYGMRTSDIEIVGEDPSGEPEPKAIAANNLQTQQDVNWYLLRQIENIDIPEGAPAFDGDMKGERITNLGNAEGNNDAVSKAVCKGWDMYTLDAAKEYCDNEIKKIDIPSIDGLASEDWVLDQSYITEQVVTDAVSDQAQTQETIDSAQDTKITTLENKVDALEGTVVEAQFKADARDTPSLGCFILQTIGKEKTNLFSQASEIILSTTDFTNKPISAESILNGDLVRLVMSPTNYATYKVTGSYVRDDEITIEVEYGTSGSENFVFDGAVYDFTHTTPFDVGSAATKQYVDAQDEVTLNAANSYADQAIAAIEIPEVSTTGLMNTTGENICASQWKIRAPAQGGGNWTYISLAGTVGELALNHLRNPSERHHATNKGWVEDQAYVSTDSESPLVNQTITWNSSVSDTTPKLLFSSTEEYSPQSTEKILLSGNYKSNGGSPSTWSFGYNTAGNYWNYDWAFGSNLTCRYVMGDQNKCVMSIDKTGVDMPSAYIVGDYSLDGVAEEDVEAVKAQAREIDIGHRLRELKKILVNLKTALKTKSADAQQALLDVLEHVEDI